MTAAKSTFYKTVFLSVAVLGLGSASAYAEPPCSSPHGSRLVLSHSEHGESLACFIPLINPDGKRLVGKDGKLIYDTKLYSFDSSPEKRLEILEVGKSWATETNKRVCMTDASISTTPSPDCGYTIDVFVDKPVACLSREKKMYSATNRRDYVVSQNELEQCLAMNKLLDAMGPINRDPRLEKLREEVMKQD